ncbi:MAG: thermonuclease family protein [Candidatus Natronoplasma sp.]
MRTRTFTILIITFLFLTSTGCIELSQQTEGPTTTVEVIYVIDGDTIQVEWPNGTQSKVRILGIDTPEVHTEVNTTEWEGIDNESWLRTCGHKASNFTKRWITQTVNLTFDENEGKKGYHGRYLAYVELENETDLGAELIKQGWARVYPYSDCVRKDQYLEYEDDAQAENKGVWEKM